MLRPAWLETAMTSPRVSVRAVVIREDHLLLSQYKDDRGYWYVTPGGGVESGETLEEAFARETYEELGRPLPFGEILFVREIIADRHVDSALPAGFHQIELYIESKASKGPDYHPIVPDPAQIAVVWHPLQELDQILFFPKGMVEEFQNQSWPKRYYGDMR